MPTTKTLVDTDSVQTLTNKTISGSKVLATGSSTSRTLESRFAEVFNVKDYGAVGNGVTDDTTAIQATITAAIAVQGTVFFPVGTYVVSSSITINGTVQLVGAGWGSIIKVNSAASRFLPLLVQGDAFAAVNGVVMRDFKIDGSQKGQLDAGLIQFNNAINFLADHLWVTNGGTPGESSTQGVNGISVSAGALGEVGSQGVIENCLAEANTKAAINVSTESINVTVQNNIVRSNTGNTRTPGIQILGGYNTRVTGNKVYNNQGAGIFVATSGGVGTYRNTRYGLIAENHVYSNGQGTVEGPGIFVANAAASSQQFGRIRIVNNQVYSNGVNVSSAGIHIQNENHISVMGNHIYLNKSAGVILEATYGSRVIGNTIEDNNTSNTTNVSGVYLLAKATATLGNVDILQNKFVNNAGQTQKYPVYFDNAAAQSVSRVTIKGNTAVGHATKDGYGSAYTAPTNFVLDDFGLGYFNVKDYGAVGDGVTDDTAAIQAAITAAGNGGVVWFPTGTYLTTAFLNAENKRGITLIGPSGQYGWSGSRIIGSHTGKTILSLVGSLDARIDNLILEGDTASRPKTGLLLGRSSSASAGGHTFVNLKVQGFYSVAGVYNIASETNTFVNPHIETNAAPLAGLYMAQSDTQSIGGLTASSMEHNLFYGGTIGNTDTDAGSTGIYIDSGGSTGHIHFYDTFIPKEGGVSYITVRLGVIDATATTFPISFNHCLGESSSGPVSGVRLISSSLAYQHSGFTLDDCRFQTPTTNNILADATYYLVGAQIRTPWKSSGTLPSTLGRCDGCDLSLQSESAITITTLIGSRLQYGVAPTITTNTNNWMQDLAGNRLQNAGVVATASLPAAAAVMDGTVLIEDGGAGDRNLIVYAGGQRFRIDGGANF